MDVAAARFDAELSLLEPDRDGALRERDRGDMLAGDTVSGERGITA